MIITVHVKPNCKKNKIVSSAAGVYKIELKAKAENGKANASLEKFLEKEFGKKIKILTGKTSRKKTIKVYNS